MSTTHDLDAAIHDIEELLQSAPPGQHDPMLVGQQARAVLKLLAQDEPRWIDEAQAKRLLGFERDSTLATWVRLGLLRSRRQPSGRLQIRLDDALYRRMENEALLAIGGDELTPEELRILSDSRPGTTPWERANHRQSK